MFSRSLIRRSAATLVVAGLSVAGLSACSKDKATETTAAAETVVSETVAGSVAETVAIETVATDSAPVAAETTTAAAGATDGVKIDLKGKKIVYLINGALGDKGFYDSGQAGIKALEATYGATTRTLEGNYDSAKFQALVDAAFEEGDAIFTISYGMEDMIKAAAKANPGKPVVNLDFDIADADKNVTSVDFVEEQSAYLAGVTAALVTTDASIAGTNPDMIVGVVGGDSDPVTTSFMFAYENGAKSVLPDIKVERKTLGGAWEDQAKGKQAAEQLYDGGSDVVFQVAAAAGLGVLQAAKDRNLFAIGVDANQNDLQPGRILASDIKNVGGTIEKVAASMADGTYQPGVVLTYGIAENGVGLDMSAKAPVLNAEVQAKINAIRDQIVAGTLVVERYKAA
jgi:basic membrane protein A and related proteins